MNLRLILGWESRTTACNVNRTNHTYIISRDKNDVYQPTVELRRSTDVERWNGLMSISLRNHFCCEENRYLMWSYNEVKTPTHLSSRRSNTANPLISGGYTVLHKYSELTWLDVGICWSISRGQLYFLNPIHWFSYMLCIPIRRTLRLSFLWHKK